MPKATVIVPTYNRSGCILDAIKSILNQTFQNFEIIIVDDGSTDNTHEILQPFLMRFSEKIKYYYQRNSGAPAAKNTGIRESKSDIIAFLDSDDIWLPDKLEKSLAFLEQNNYQWVTTAAYRQNGANREIRKIPNEFLQRKGEEIALLKNGIFFFSSVLIIPSGVMLRKICFQKVGLFDESLRVGEDTDMWLRLEESGLIGGYIDEPLFIYRVHSGGMTKVKTSSALNDHINLAAKHAKILGMHNSTIRNTYAEFLWRCSDIFFTKGCYWKSLCCYLKSWVIYPEFNKLNKTIIIAKKILHNNKYENCN